MPSSVANLQALPFANGLTIWHYGATDETPPTESGHFDPAAGLLGRGDLIFCSPQKAPIKHTGHVSICAI